MAENSKIEWCHHTFNPWRGCRAISDACANCYAKVLVEGRLQQDFSARIRAAESTWKQPLAWNRKAAKEGVRYRVFCASLADVFDAEVPDEWRLDLFRLIVQTPWLDWLDWLLLTKRPKVAREFLSNFAMAPGKSGFLTHNGDTPRGWGGTGEIIHGVGHDQQWPLPNVWLGTTVENQAMAEARILHLLATPAAVRFLSMEPLLGPVDLTAVPWSFNGCSGETVKTINALTGNITVNDSVFGGGGGVVGLDWVITGGESGPGARPSHPDWFRSLRDQCAAAGVAYLHKQNGEWIHGAQGVLAGGPKTGRRGDISATGRYVIEIRDGEGSRQVEADAHHWNARSHCLGDTSFRVGKKAAGRHLDGVLHDGYPVVG